MTEQPGPVARGALALTDWTERWVPDAFIFALIATVLVIAAALAATPATLLQTPERRTPNVTSGILARALVDLDVFRRVAGRGVPGSVLFTGR